MVVRPCCGPGVTVQDMGLGSASARRCRRLCFVSGFLRDKPASAGDEFSEPSILRGPGMLVLARSPPGPGEEWEARRPVSDQTLYGSDYGDRSTAGSLPRLDFQVSSKHTGQSLGKEIEGQCGKRLFRIRKSIKVTKPRLKETEGGTNLLELKLSLKNRRFRKIWRSLSVGMHWWFGAS